jgi:hypothetical protein
MRSYPIWNRVQACIYQSDKSWGAKDDSNVEILIGTSAQNSHTFVTTRTLRVVTEKETIFKFYVDGVKIKEARFQNVKGRATGDPVMETFNSVDFNAGDFA